MKDRSDATPISSGYTIDLYCCVCKELKYADRGREPLAQAFADGPNAYYEARRAARRMGWILHKDGYATCPNCRKKKPAQEK